MNYDLFPQKKVIHLQPRKKREFYKQVIFSI
ncbi:hypothetical protein FPSM_02256 [Flavobacterium psychrophilum]|nr:hypothetical protein FPSM_02256 [Flavobacterium psychrophilum]